MIAADDFAELMKAFLPLPPGKLLVGVSGGIDSLALVMLLHEWAPEKTDIIAVTVDHQLRRTSALEATWVKKLMRKHGIAHHILTLTPPEQKTGLPAWAREARYEALELFGVEQGAHSLFLAHHLDDQIETILMRLMEGSHWRGLSGMYPERDGKVLTYFRPLLSLRKKNLIETVGRFGITESVADPTNDQKKQGRGFVRNVFLPNLKHMGFQDQLLFKLGRESLALRLEEDKRINLLIGKKVNLSECGYAHITLKDFKAIDEYVRDLIIARLIEIIGAPRFPFKKDSFDEMMKRMPGEGSLGGCRVFVKDDQLYVMREARNYPPEIELKGKGVCFFQSRFLIHYKIPASKTYKLVTLGKKRTHRLLKENEVIKERVKFPDIYFTLPAITCLDELVSVPHLCYSRDDKLVILVESLFHKRQQLKDQRKGLARE